MIKTDKIKDYVKNGGKLFNVNYIDIIRDGGTKVVECTSSKKFYINKDTNKFHSEYPTTDSNEIKDELLINYIIERMETYTNRLIESYNRDLSTIGLVKNSYSVCSCDNGTIICPGCGGDTSLKMGVCAGCHGTGTRICGKCGGK